MQQVLYEASERPLHPHACFQLYDGFEERHDLVGLVEPQLGALPRGYMHKSDAYAVDPTRAVDGCGNLRAGTFALGCRFPPGERSSTTEPVTAC